MFGFKKKLSKTKIVDGITICRCKEIKHKYLIHSPEPGNKYKANLCDKHIRRLCKDGCMAEVLGDVEFNREIAK